MHLKGKKATLSPYFFPDTLLKSSIMHTKQQQQQQPKNNPLSKVNTAAAEYNGTCYGLWWAFQAPCKLVGTGREDHESIYSQRIRSSLSHSSSLGSFFLDWQCFLTLTLNNYDHLSVNEQLIGTSMTYSLSAQLLASGQKQQVLRIFTERMINLGPNIGFKGHLDRKHHEKQCCYCGYFL